jgi:ABC-type transport system involved in multi-copper enzyme maturation permease subunit
MMSGWWNDVVRLIGVLLIISIFFIMVVPPEQIQQLLNTLSKFMIKFVIVLAAAITFILIIREYKKSETEW